MMFNGGKAPLAAAAALLRSAASSAAPLPRGAAPKTPLVCLLAVLFFAGCAFREPSEVAFFDIDKNPLGLDALSKNAVLPVLPIKNGAKFRYAPAKPLVVGEAASFALSYALNGAEKSLDKEAEIVVKLHVDKSNAATSNNAEFLLPVDFAFLGGRAEGAKTITYSMPINEGELDEIVISCDNIDAGNAGTKSAPELHILKMELMARSYGVERVGEELFITPWTNAQDSIRIAPPEETLGFNLRLSGLQKRSSFSFRGKKFMLENSTAETLTVFNGFYGNGEDIFEAESGGALLYLASSPEFPLEPIKADPGFILDSRAQKARDSRFELYRWDIFPSILIFDIANYAVQDKMLRRLAFFSEKKGFRGRILSEEELEDKHGWNAHDYRASTLADFFNRANKMGFPLLEEERELERILLANKILIAEGGGAGGGLEGSAGGGAGAKPPLYKAGEGAIISISRQSNPELRERFMVHEAFHGIFFVDAAFRDFAFERYRKLNPRAKAFMRSYFDYLAYDINDEFLVVNEFMAYCLQQRPGETAEYFGKYAATKIEESDWRHSVLPPKDEEAGNWPLLAKAFEEESRAFSDYAAKRWALAAGRVWRIRAAR